MPEAHGTGACRMPAEWEPQACVWASRPHNAATWPGCLADAQAQFDAFVGELARRVTVRETAAEAIATDDAWVRDYAPLFVLDVDGRPLAHDFRFDNWGGKYGPCPRDEAAGRRIAERLGVTCVRHAFVLEGGAIDVNGRGTALTTRSCLLDPRRNPGASPERVERLLCDALGLRHVVWLAGGITGDDTGGHVDDVARFVGPGTVVAVRAPVAHPDHDVLERNWDALRGAVDQDGEPLTLVELPVPPPLRAALPAGADYDVARDRLPASYANFLVANGGVFVPVFDQPTDAPALAGLGHAMPGHAVVPVPCDRLVVGLGGPHCLTMPVPAEAGWTGGPVTT